MSTLETKKITPQSGTTVTLGAAGDSVSLPTGVTLQTDTFKDAGGNVIIASDGAGTFSNVKPALEGCMVYLNSATGTGITSIEFTSGIDSTYDEYIFYMINFNPNTTEMFEVNFSDDNGANYDVNKTTTSPRAFNYENGTSQGVSYWTAGDLHNSSADILLGEHTGADADESLSGFLILYGPGTSAFQKQYVFRTNNCVDAGSPISTDMAGAGTLNVTAPINAIKFTLQGGGAWDGTVHMYGIK